MAKHLILVVDDDPAIVSMLERSLGAEGYEPLSAETGETALEFIDTHMPDLIILDLGLPGIGGLEVCKRIRYGLNEVPILMLTARSSVADRVTGLETGADDYMIKPFALEELLARIGALLRRRASGGGRMRLGDLVLDADDRTALRGGRDLDLTRREFDLLETLMLNKGQVLDRFQLMMEVWGYDFEIETNTVDVYVGYLRRKLEANDEPCLIHTARGIGFMLRAK